MGLYGNFPIATYPACQVVMMLANKSPSNLAYAFAMYANASTTTSPVLPLSDLAHAWMIAVLDPTNFMRRFQHGYGRFFAKIVRADGLVFETRANVSAITPLPATDQVQVSFIDGHDRVFDAVIVAARPNQIASALPPAHPMTHLYTHVGRQTEINTNTHGVYGVAVMGFRNHSTMADNATYIFDYDAHMDRVAVGDFNHSFTLMRLIKPEAADTIFTVTFATQSNASTTERTLKSTLAVAGFADLDILKIQLYADTPTVMSVEAMANGWHAKAERANGVDGIYFVGEVFSGHGVPTTFLYSHRWTRATFHRSTEDATEQRKTLDLSRVDRASASMQSIGTKAYAALLRRPKDALELGIDPALLVDHPFELAVAPIVWLSLLVACAVALRSLEHLLIRHTSLHAAKVKKVAIYCVELVVTTTAVWLMLTYTRDVLLFELPLDLLETQRVVYLVGFLINGLYFCEMLFDPTMRPSLVAHHVACLALYTLMTLLHTHHKSVGVMRISLFNLLLGVTEQNVFLVMLLRRVAPHILTPANYQASAVYYVVSRVLLTSLCIYALVDVASEPEMQSGWSSVALVGYAVLLLAQIGTQCVSAQAQASLGHKVDKLD
ncbi:Aste57867_16116 [Aphanomyces stellatus]|uniref:Aste57867_16116 protein n=2 Tax=Aphanomyces stellatus TaxID=120398 RepID=A0A485L5H4_9STRA|nr:hypothetical protein As57867_016060 [Aphanomyces stellatus]VFT92899.1 Aste57867_16116 [Aphanomyces stellatus]